MPSENGGLIIPFAARPIQRAACAAEDTCVVGAGEEQRVRHAVGEAADVEHDGAEAEAGLYSEEGGRSVQLRVEPAVHGVGREHAALLLGGGRQEHTRDGAARTSNGLAGAGDGRAAVRVLDRNQTPRHQNLLLLPLMWVHWG